YSLISTLFPYTTLFRSRAWDWLQIFVCAGDQFFGGGGIGGIRPENDNVWKHAGRAFPVLPRKSTLGQVGQGGRVGETAAIILRRSEAHTSELQSPDQLV